MPITQLGIIGASRLRHAQMKQVVVCWTIVCIYVRFVIHFKRKKKNKYRSAPTVDDLTTEVLTFAHGIYE